MDGFFYEKIKRRNEEIKKKDAEKNAQGYWGASVSSSVGPQPEVSGEYINALSTIHRDTMHEMDRFRLEEEYKKIMEQKESEQKEEPDTKPIPKPKKKEFRD